MAAGAFAFSVMSAAVKLLGESLPLFEIVVLRGIVVTVLAGTAVYRSGHSFRPQQPGRVLQRAVFGFASLVCYFYSVIHLPLADATVIFFTHPVLTALGAAVALGEHMGWREGRLILVSLLGVVLVARPSFVFGAEAALDPFAVGTGIAGAVLAAGSWVTIRSIKQDPPLLIVFYFSLFTLVFAAPVMLLEMGVPSLADLALVVLAGVGTHLAQLWITWGLRLERAGRATAVGYIQIVFAAGLGWAVFSEVPDAWTWVGAAIIMLSTLRLVRLRPTVPLASPTAAPPLS
jgi:drug/metabolite transporter (DMT)-like permease